MTPPAGAPAESPARRPWVLLFVAVCLVAINLRLTITGVGPLIEEIADDQGVPVSALGALASLPLVTWAIFSPLAHGLSARLGMSRTISWALILLTIATVWRSLPGSAANLWIGTALTGIGLAVGNVLMPAVIKRDFGSRVPLVMGLYTALLGGLGALGAGIVVPISQAELGGDPLGWRIALLATGALLPAAVILWVLATRKPSPHDRADTVVVPATTAPTGPTPAGPALVTNPGRKVWSDRLAWAVTLYMGTQSAVFYMLSTWLAPYLTSVGISPVAAGIYLMVFQLIGIAASVLLPTVSRGRIRRWIPAIVPTLTLIGVVGIVVAPASLLVWLTIGGLGSGGALTLSLTLMATRARTLSHSSALSGMAQSFGYLIAAVGPTVFGMIHGWSGEWVAPFALLWAIALVQIMFGFIVGRDRYVFDSRVAQ